MKDECNHENVTKLRFIDSHSVGVHTPESETWLVRCNECSEEFEESFIGG